uniref:Uncharacterized protein n=1 Tax=Anguilla anguilla TaxID=7936 RepID=A0A0E9SNE9_ANGAN
MFNTYIAHSGGRAFICQSTIAKPFK